MDRHGPRSSRSKDKKTLMEQLFDADPEVWQLANETILHHIIHGTQKNTFSEDNRSLKNSTESIPAGYSSSGSSNGSCTPKGINPQNSDTIDEAADDSLKITSSRRPDRPVRFELPQQSAGKVVGFPTNKDLVYSERVARDQRIGGPEKAVVTPHSKSRSQSDHTHLQFVSSD